MKNNSNVTRSQEFHYVWITLKELVFILWKEVRKNKRWNKSENNGI